MATIGVDCEVILDGTGYFVEPHSYTMHQPRVRKATVVKSGAERYVDTALGRRVWTFTVLATNDLLRFDGRAVGTTGEQIRDALRASYAKIATPLGFTDPFGTAVNVHFDDYKESVRDLRTLLAGSVSYLCRVTLVEV
jgi:hypothetical protein